MVDATVVSTFLDENPGYEISYINDDLRDGVTIRMTKGSFHFDQFLSWSDIHHTPSDDLKFIFDSILIIGKEKIEKLFELDRMMNWEG